MYIIQYKWNQQLVGGEHRSCVGSVWSHPSDLVSDSSLAMKI